jgi:polysaccharide pyruvyl transferase WcaK-like protein
VNAKGASPSPGDSALSTPRAPAMPPRIQPAKIAVLGPFGFGNLGDAAIQDAVIAALRRRFPGVEIAGISLNPVDTRERHGIEAFPMNYRARLSAPPSGEAVRPDRRPAVSTPRVERFKRLLKAVPLARAGVRATRLAIDWTISLRREFAFAFESLHALRRLDCLIISGGGQLSDAWGGPWHQPWDLLRWSALARLSGVDLVALSVGAGPLDSKLSRLLVRNALKLARYLSLRDPRSADLIAAIGYAGPRPVFPDLAYGLDVRRPGTERPGPAKVVGVNPMAVFDPRVWPVKDRAKYLGYLGKLAEFTAWLLDRGLEVRLFSSQVRMDRPAIDDLKAILAQRGLTTGPSLGEAQIEKVADLTAFLSQTDIVVTSRLHSTIIAHLVGTPVVAVSPHSKVDEAMRLFGQSAYCLAVEQFTPDLLRAAFEALESRLETEREQILTRANEFRARLNEQYRVVFGEG